MVGFIKQRGFQVQAWSRIPEHILKSLRSSGEVSSEGISSYDSDRPVKDYQRKIWSGEDKT